MKHAGRALALLAALLALWLLGRHLPVTRWVIAGAHAVHGLGWLGPLATALGITALTLCGLPIIPFIVAAGWLYGVWGALVSLPASVASASIAFLAARAFGGAAAAQALRRWPRAGALASLAAEGKLLTVVLVRLAPILPFTPSNAVLGLTPMRLRDLALGTALGMAPGIVLYSWAGSLLPDAEALERGDALHTRLVWVLFAAAFAAAAILGVAAARRLRAPPK